MKILMNLALTLSLIVIGGMTSTLQAAGEITLAEAINQAGRQRMLTQRIVKSYCQMGQDVRYTVAEEHLQGGIALFEKQLAQLQAFSKDSETLRGLTRVQQLWLPVKLIAQTSVERSKAESLRQNAEKLLTAAHQVVLMLEEQSGTSQGHLVNIAGRQRMLSQRLGNLYMLQSWGFSNEQYSKDYSKAKMEFEEALHELIAAKENTPEIAKNLNAVSQKWDVFKLSDRMGDNEYVPGLVARMLDKILIQMNEITGQYAALK